jgi:hypothetical protein
MLKTRKKQRTKGILISLPIWLKTQKYNEKLRENTASVSSFGRNSEADE